MAKLVLPRVQAMVICDSVAESTEGGVFNLQSVRSKIIAPSFPYKRTFLSAYLQVSGHQGQVACHLEISSAAENEVIYQGDSKLISFSGPTVVVPAIFRLRNSVFPSPGVYYVEVYGENKLIGERPIHLQLED